MRCDTRNSECISCIQLDFPSSYIKSVHKIASAHVRHPFRTPTLNASRMVIQYEIMEA